MISYDQVLILFFQFVLVGGLVLVSFRARSHLSLSALFVYLGVLQPLQVLLASSVMVTPIEGLSMSPGSVVLFPAGLFALLLVYIREDALETRKVVYALFIANLLVSALYLLIRMQLGNEATVNLLGLPPELFTVHARILAVGTLLLFVDAVMVVLVYEWLGSRWPLFLRAATTLVTVLAFDTLAFAVGAFAGTPVFSSSLIVGGLIGKGVAGVCYAALLVFYLRYFEPSPVPAVTQWSEPFQWLTYRERYEKEVRRVERISARERQLFDHSTDGIVVLDESLAIREMNSTAEELLGLSRGAAIDQSLDAIRRFSPSFAQELLVAVRHTLAGEPLPPIAGTVEGRSGSDSEPRSLHVVARPVAGQTAVELILRDNTAVERIRADRERLRTQLRHAQRLQAAGQIASGIAHDFNNLLTTVVGACTLARMELDSESPDPAAVRAWIDDIDLAAERSTRLIRDLMLFSRPTDGQATSVDVSESIRGLERLLHHLVHDKVEVELDLPNGLPSVWLDPSRLDQVVINLAVNANEAMDERGGTLRITTTAVTNEGGGVRISVSDRGRGMSPEMISRATEPFFSTKETGKGTGLGLATVQTIATEAGGSLEIESELGVGTTVHVFLPRHVGAEPEVSVPRLGEETIRVLLCEGDATVRSAVDRSLRRYGMEVVAVDRPADAIAAVAETTRPFDFLLTDADLQDLTGPELAKRVRAEYPHTQLVVMSEHPHERFDPEGLEAWDYEFVRKPFEFDELLARMDQLAERYFGWRRSG